MTGTIKRLFRRTIALPGEMSVAFDALSPAASRLKAWAPDWKTDLICRVLCARPGLFLDVGANVGQTLLDYLCCPERRGYIGFEPNTCAREIVRSLIADNGLNDCAIVPVGLSDASGLVPLFSRPGVAVDGSASMVAGLRPNQAREADYISCHRGDDILPELLSGRSVSLVKIDIEGGELAALSGMTRFLETGPWIICEVLGRDPAADAGAYRERIAGLMKALAGYSVLRIVKGGGLETIERFPDVVWSEGNQHDFDYLFVPVAEREQATALF